MDDSDEILLPDGRVLPYRRAAFALTVAPGVAPWTGAARAASAVVMRAKRTGARDRRAERRGPEHPGRVLDVRT